MQLYLGAINEVIENVYMAFFPHSFHSDLVSGDILICQLLLLFVFESMERDETN